MCKNSTRSFFFRLLPREIHLGLALLLHKEGVRIRLSLVQETQEEEEQDRLPRTNQTKIGTPSRPVRRGLHLQLDKSRRVGTHGQEIFLE